MMMSHPVLTFTSRRAKSEKEKPPIHSAPSVSSRWKHHKHIYFFQNYSSELIFRVSVNQPGSGELCFCPHVPQTALIMMSLHCFNNNSSLRLRGIHLYQPYLLAVADHFEIFTLSRVNIWQRILNNKIKVGIRGKTNSISSTKTNIFHRCMIVSLPFVLSSAASIALNTWNSLLFKFFQKCMSLDTFGKIKKKAHFGSKDDQKGKIWSSSRCWQHADFRCSLSWYSALEHQKSQECESAQHKSQLNQLQNNQPLSRKTDLSSSRSSIGPRRPLE